MSKIALLFLTYDNITHMGNRKLDEYLTNCNVYIHPKNESALNYLLRDKIVSEIIPTKWGDISIVIATLSLLMDAFQHPDNQWFCLCSQDVFPAVSFETAQAFLYEQSKSIFSTMPMPPLEKRSHRHPAICKSQQWWAMNRRDVRTILDSLGLSGGDKEKLHSVRTNPRFAEICRQIPPKVAMDEYFFLSALRWENSAYDYTDQMVCYTKWMDRWNLAWVSKHPTLFNRLLSVDKKAIETNHSIFIRKTLPTFRHSRFGPKKNCVLVVIGDANIDIPNYSGFLSKFLPDHDIYLISMRSDIGGLSVDIKHACIQCFFVVWNRVDAAISTLRQLLTSVPGERGEVGWPKYETIHVIEESVNANEYDGSSGTVPIASHTHTPASVHSSNGTRKGYKQVRTPKHGGGGTKRHYR